MMRFIRQANRNIIRVEDPLPGRIMDLFDREGILVLLKRNSLEYLPYINRPSVIWMD